MTEQCGDLEQCIRSAAGSAIRRCAQGLLTVETLSAEVRKEWEAQSFRENQPVQQLLNRMALRFCSRTLYSSCCSLREETRNCAFENLYRYLAQHLRYSPYALQLIKSEGSAEDVLQMALTIVQQACMRNPPAGPGDPAAFLKWTMTILIRQAYAFVTKMEQEAAMSLEAHCEILNIDRLEDARNYEPDANFDFQELQLALKNAILSLSNKRYRQVLSGTYLAGLEERELATLLGVRVQEVYLWRCRALKALRSNRKVVEALRLWLR